ncbi:MAG: HNH endonuclease [Bacteroidota bacterium]|jgi:hypothetical protein|nr:HNH endonuclease [Bacteroidota bacterium]
MFEHLPNEKWRQFTFTNSDALQKKYMVSNMGRIASYTESFKKDGTLLKGSAIEGYRIIRLKVKDTYTHFLLHRAVGQLFLKKPKADEKFIIHLNHNKKDNRAENLKWATQELVIEHNKNNPRVKAAKKKLMQKTSEMKKGLKLTLAQVKDIKKMLANPKRKLTYKQLAEKYGVSEMAITRIKRGENWGHVKI